MIKGTVVKMEWIVLERNSLESCESLDFKLHIFKESRKCFPSRFVTQGSRGRAERSELRTEFRGRRGWRSEQVEERW